MKAHNVLNMVYYTIFLFKQINSTYARMMWCINVRRELEGIKIMLLLVFNIHYSISRPSGSGKIITPVSCFVGAKTNTCSQKLF